MIHSEENNGFEIIKPIREISLGTVFILTFGVLVFIFGYNLIKKDKNARSYQKFNTTTHCPANTFEPIKLTGSFNSIKTDSVKTDKLNFPSYSDLLGGKPKGWGLKK